MRLTLIICFYLAVSNNAMSSEVIYIENKSIKVGIAPGVGGRMVHLSLQGGKNILKSHDAFRVACAHRFMQPNHNAGFFPYDGVIIWLGPQKEWWAKQSVNTERKEQESIWPPDPYLIYGDFQLVEQTDTSLNLIGPYSPVSGVRLAKKYTISGNKLDWEVTMVNESNSEISWDIWTNARFNTTASFFVPAVSKTNYRLEGSDNCSAKIKEKWDEDTFTFKIDGVPQKGNCWKKAFLHPVIGQVVGVEDSTLFSINFDYVQPSNIHPNHGFVEVFLRTSKDESENLLELEHHSAYVTLKPGEKFSKKQYWVLEFLE